MVRWAADSASVKRVRERRPWRWLLREELALPRAETGPRDLAPLARAAAARRSEVGRVESVGAGFIWLIVALGIGEFWQADGRW